MKVILRQTTSNCLACNVDNQNLIRGQIISNMCSKEGKFQTKINFYSQKATYKTDMLTDGGNLIFESLTKILIINTYQSISFKCRGGMAFCQVSALGKAGKTRSKSYHSYLVCYCADFEKKKLQTWNYYRLLWNC